MSSNPGVDVKTPPFIGLWLKAMRVPFLQATFVPVIPGGGRILTAGLIRPSTHLIVSTSCLILGSLIGFYLIFQPGLYQLFWFGLIGVVSTYFYVGPPFKLAYRGVGEFLVGLNFGPVMTV